MPLCSEATGIQLFVVKLIYPKRDSLLVLKYLFREGGNTVACSNSFLFILQDSKAKKAKSKDKKVPEADKRKKPKKEEEQKWKW